MYFFLMSAGMIAIPYMWWLEPNFEFTFCALFVMISFSCAMVIGRKTEQKVIHVPAQSYETLAMDNPYNSTFQLVYFLKYKEEFYNLSQLPPKENPALILYTKKPKDKDIIYADFVIEKRDAPLTWRQWLQKIYHVIVFVVAVSVPILYSLWDYGYTEKNYMEPCFVITLSFAFTFTLKGNRSAPMRFLYYLFRFFEIFGWISIPVKIFLE